MANSWIRDDLRLALLLRDGLACGYCGVTVESGAQLTLDHIIPRTKGGSNKPENLITCCHICNSRRGNRPFKRFVLHVSVYLGVNQEDILAHIQRCRKRSVKKYRAIAQDLMQNRNTALQVLSEISENDFKSLLARAGSHHAR